MEPQRRRRRSTMTTSSLTKTRSGNLPKRSGRTKRPCASSVPSLAFLQTREKLILPKSLSSFLSGCVVQCQSTRTLDHDTPRARGKDRRRRCQPALRACDCCGGASVVDAERSRRRTEWTSSNDCERTIYRRGSRLFFRAFGRGHVPLNCSSSPTSTLRFRDICVFHRLERRFTNGAGRALLAHSAANAQMPEKRTSVAPEQRGHRQPTRPWITATTTGRARAGAMNRRKECSSQYINSSTGTRSSGGQQEGEWVGPRARGVSRDLDDAVTDRAGD